MGRTLDITIDGKDFTIEYDRESTLQLMEAQEKENSGVGSAIDLLYYGCLKHHRKDMPTREDLALLMVSVDDFEGLVKVLTDMVQEVVNAFQKNNSEKTKNFKWGVRK